jgi:O-antigen ligase/polysaccharide polymerase Wzy-like membrane protein
MQLKGYLTHKNIFLFGIILIAVGMPLSRFLVSISYFVLLGNWLVERNFISKWDTLRTSKTFWAFVAIYLFYVIGLLWTSDYTYGIKDLRTKLPMLWLPVLFYTSPKITKKDYHIVLHFFVLACITASFCSMAAYFGFLHKKVENVRDISLFESHIRFSLMIVLSILYLFFSSLKSVLLKQRIIYIVVTCWLLFFLVFLQSFTGLAILAVLAFIGIIVFLFSSESIVLKTSFLIIVVGGFIYALYLVKDEYKKVYAVNKIDLKALPKCTINGNTYLNDTIYKFTENSNYVYILICDDELKKEWNKKSKLNFDGIDNQRNSLRHTLIRYLTSKDLTKDSVGVSKLSNEDIIHIENGYANYLYINQKSIRSRIHEIVWEFAMRNHEINGHSLLMRLEFWKTAYHIIKQNLWFGVGTGDVKLAFKEQYEKENTTLKKEWQLRSHNQYLATTVALGLTGLFLFLIHLFAPFFSNKKISVFFIFFILIQLLSFVNEDTLETQAGLTFCIFFTQLLFHNDEYNV